MSKFQVGQNVRCIDDSAFSGSIYLTDGKTYTVVAGRYATDGCNVINDKGDKDWYYDYRFEVIQERTEEEIVQIIFEKYKEYIDAGVYLDLPGAAAIRKVLGSLGRDARSVTKTVVEHILVEI